MIGDQELIQLVETDRNYRGNIINLIASENYTSKSVRLAAYNFLENKYAEGYPQKRYYSGCEHIDPIEQLAIERLKSLFHVNYANVQPWSGSQANQAAYAALLPVGSTILSLSLPHGGHLTHGSPFSQLSTIYKFYHYELDHANELDYEHILHLGQQYKPHCLIAGYTSFSGAIDWQKMRLIADKLNCYLHADIAHTAGLIAAKVLPNPSNLADVITSTTHKTLRGPRGGIIMSHRIDLAKKLQMSVFPGLQGGPNVSTIAAKAACFYEALQPEFALYGKQVILNAQCLANSLIESGIVLLNPKPANHTVIINLQNTNLNGLEAQNILMSFGISTNKNLIPNDTRSAWLTSGLRLGTAALTTLGFDEQDMVVLADLISKLLKYRHLRSNSLKQLNVLRDKVKQGLDNLYS